jgi:hypothetical protein
MRTTRANGAEKRNGNAADGWRNRQTVRAGQSTRRSTRARVFLSNAAFRVASGASIPCKALLGLPNPHRKKVENSC